MDIEKSIGDIESSFCCTSCGKEVHFTVSPATHGEDVACPNCGEMRTVVLENPEEVDRVKKEINKAIDDLSKTIKQVNKRLR